MKFPVAFGEGSGFGILARRRARGKVGVGLSHSHKAVNRVSVSFMDRNLSQVFIGTVKAVKARSDEEPVRASDSI